MTWSTEDLGEGTYGVILTQGKNSRTVFLCYTSKDAEELLEALEFWQLMKGGVPTELAEPKKPARGKR